MEGKYRGGRSDAKRKLHPRYASADAPEKARKDGYEAPHTIWIREDLWAKLKTAKREQGVSLKYLVNEALYELLMRDTVEKQTGVATPFKESDYYPQRKTTGLKGMDSEPKD